MVSGIKCNLYSCDCRTGVNSNDNYRIAAAIIFAFTIVMMGVTAVFGVIVYTKKASKKTAEFDRVTYTNSFLSEGFMISCILYTGRRQFAYKYIPFHALTSTIYSADEVHLHLLSFVSRPCTNLKSLIRVRALCAQATSI